MHVELRYFTGTGNSLAIIDTCRSVFQEKGHEVAQKKICLEERSLPDTDLAGFCFPVYAFGLPRIARKYLHGLVPAREPVKAFVIITAGDADESGFSVLECASLLKKKNYIVHYSGVIEMPNNWTVSPKPPYPPSKDEALQIIGKGVNEARIKTAEIVEEVTNLHQFNFPARYGRLKFWWDYLAFRYMGVGNMWRMFRVYDSCDGCGLCMKICPVHSITIKNSKPVWSKACEQCMRCVNFCPSEAIYQTYGGDTIGKNRYHLPGFKPLHD
ncbi:MAG: EFR1 family ferrodoxin [Bacteroidales bacterium]